MLLIQVNVSDFHLPWNVFQIYTRLSQWLCQANKPCSKDVIKSYQIIYLCKNKNGTLSGGKILCLLPLRMICPCNLLFSFPSEWKTIMLVFSLIFWKLVNITYTHTSLYSFVQKKLLNISFFTPYHSISAKSRAFMCTFA